MLVASQVTLGGKGGSIPKPAPFDGELSKTVEIGMR